MKDPGQATPLLALSSVVLDCETTGLDARRARLVQLAAVKVSGDRIESGATLDTLVDPGEPIPPGSTDIHGIRDADVAGAPTAADVLRELAAFSEGAVIVGHTIAYDLAILQREAALAGVDWQAPRALDVRLLAQVVAPSLASYGLDGLCSWLGIAIEGRHTAMGDTQATAKAYVALLPLLREKGIRTLAEAEAVSQRLAERAAVAAGEPASPQLPAAPKAAEPSRVPSLDSYPYRHRVEAVMSAPPAVIGADATLGDAVEQLIELGVSSLFVEQADGRYGIVTERDVLRALHERGAEAPRAPLADFTSAPLASVPANAFVYRAIGRMDRLGVRHLGVTDADGRLVGAVTARNLLRHRMTTAMTLGDRIEVGEDAAALSDAWGTLAAMAARLTEEEVDARTVAAVISGEICALTRRAAELGEARMRDAGKGGPPVAYALLVLGSGGRGESLLAADQDNAIVFAEGKADGPEDRWFEELGTHVADLLDQVGVPYCKGGVMAKNAVWRRSLEDWKATVESWIVKQRPEDLLNVDIFYDGLPVHGDRALGESLWAYAYEKGGEAPTFQRALSETLRGWHSPLGLFGGLKTDSEGRIDLKWHGLLPLTTAARVLSIKGRQPARSTPARFAAAADRASPDQIEGLRDAHRTILSAILRQQIADGAAGIAPSSKVDPKILPKGEREALQAAIRRIPGAIDLIREGMI